MYLGPYYIAGYDNHTMRKEHSSAFTTLLSKSQGSGLNQNYCDFLTNQHFRFFMKKAFWRRKDQSSERNRVDEVNFPMKICLNVKDPNSSADIVHCVNPETGAESANEFGPFAEGLAEQNKQTMQLKVQDYRTRVLECCIIPSLVDSGEIETQGCNLLRDTDVCDDSCKVRFEMKNPEVDVDAIIAVAQHVNQGGTRRFLREHITSKGAAYLDDDKQKHNHIASVVRMTPLPMAAPNLDKASCIYFSSVIATYKHFDPGRPKSGHKGHNDLRIFQRKSRESVTPCVLKNLIFTSIFLRTSGNDEPIASLFRRLSRRKGGFPSWPKSLGIADGEELPYPVHGGLRCLTIDDIWGYTGFLATECGTRSGNLTEDWNGKEGVQMMISPQFKSSIPNAFKQSAEKQGRLMAAIWSELGSGHDDKKEPGVSDNGGNDVLTTLWSTKSRGTFIECLLNVINTATSMIDPENTQQEDNHFLAHKVTADIEELFHGNDYEAPCFEDEEEHIVIGYGAMQCLKIYKPKGEQEDTINTGDHVKTFKTLVTEVRSKLSNMSPVQLLTMGLQLDTTGRVVWSINHRPFGAVDVEHMLCKVYLCLDRTRGNRSLCVSSPVNKSSWPTYDTKTFSDSRTRLYKIFARNKSSFEELIKQGEVFRLPEVFEPFKLQKTDNNES